MVLPVGRVLLVALLVGGGVTDVRSRCLASAAVVCFCCRISVDTRLVVTPISPAALHETETSTPNERTLCFFQTKATARKRDVVFTVSGQAGEDSAYYLVVAGFDRRACIESNVCLYCSYNGNQLFCNPPWILSFASFVCRRLWADW